MSMVQKTMILVAAKHKEWLEIVLSFGCKQETSRRYCTRNVL